VECNPWHTGVVLRALLPGPPTPAPGKSPVGPFAFGDDEYVGEILEAAGFTGVRATPHSISVRGSADAVVDVSLLSFMGVPEERREEAEGLLEGHLARFSVDAGSDLYDYPLAFWVVEALAPTPPA
jgi:hypothetical protein